MNRLSIAVLTLAALPVQEKKSDPIYDEQADAKADVAAATARAGKENRRVLLQFGANWCGWCHRLHDLCRADKDIAKELLYEYEVVLVDMGHLEKNLDLAASYGPKLKEAGIPYLTVLDADGKVLANQDTGAFETKSEAGPGHDPKKVLEFLKAHEAPHAKAQDLYDAALARATAEQKRVFLHFGAPWCVWCRRLEGWMASPEIAPVLSKEFVDLKIDVDRAIGGSDMLAAMRTKAGHDPKAGGIPWFVLLDAQGKILADSDGPEGNVGFPSAPAEIEHFAGMLKKSCAKMSAAEIDAIKASLDAIREKAAREKADKAAKDVKQ